MKPLGRLRAIALTILLAVVALPGLASAQGYMQLTSADALDNRPVYLGVNKSVVIDLPAPAGDVLVSNPQIADAILRTSTRLYLIGVSLGQASVFLFDSSGGQIASFDIRVEADLSSLNQLLAESITDGYVRAEALNGSIILRGQVASSTSAGRAVQLTQSMMEALITSVTNSTTTSTGTVNAATQNLTGGPGIINLIAITGAEQVALKVSVVEVQRTVAKQLGINLRGVFLDSTGTFGVGTDLAGAVTGMANAASGTGASPFNFPINTATSPSEIGMSYSKNGNGIQGTMRALEETNMLRTLAEPTLTAVSGETANFLAGGEFPVPVNSDNGSITVAFKQFGVNLAFTPVVLSPGRISLKVRSEVSDISADGAVTLDSVTIPAVSVRRAETSIELPSGGSFMIAGLIQEDTRRAASGLPWLQKLPILGSLFSSKDFQTSQTELMMIVTAYLVKPVSPDELTTPGENLYMANDAEAYFLNRLTKVYGTDGGAGAAQVGFTFD